MCYGEKQQSEKNGKCWGRGYNYIRGGPGWPHGKGSSCTDTVSDGAGHMAIWPRALPAEGTASVKALVTVFLGCSRNHVESEWLERSEEGGQP